MGKKYQNNSFASLSIPFESRVLLHIYLLYAATSCEIRFIARVNLYRFVLFFHKVTRIFVFSSRKQYFKRNDDVSYLRVFGAQVDGADEIAHVVHRPRGHRGLVRAVRTATGLFVVVDRRRLDAAGAAAGRDTRQRPVGRGGLARFGLCGRRQAAESSAVAADGGGGLFAGLLQRQAERGRYVEERFSERAGGCSRGRSAFPVADRRGGVAFARFLARRRRRRQVQRVLLGRRRGVLQVHIGRRRRRCGTRPLGGRFAHERVELRRPDHGQQGLRGRHVHHRREHRHAGARYDGRDEREPRAEQAVAVAGARTVLVGDRQDAAHIQTVPRGHCVPANSRDLSVSFILCLYQK